MDLYIVLLVFLILHIIWNTISSNSISIGVEIKLLNRYNGFVIGISNDVEFISPYIYQERLRIGFFFFNITFVFIKHDVE